MLQREKIEIAPQLMITSIESEAKELMREIPKALKPKMLSIIQTIKLLSKRINNFISNDQIDNNCRFTKEDNKTNEFYIDNDELQKEVKTLKEQNESLKSQISQMVKNINESNNTTANKELKYLLSEEKNNNKTLQLQIKSNEDNFNQLSEKYNALMLKHQELLTELTTLSNLNSDMMKNTNENKYKYEDLVLMNSELRNMIVSKENTTQKEKNNLIGQITKDSHLKKKLQEANKKIALLAVELKLKDEKIKALRKNNNDLEHKSNLVLKKWDTVSEIELRCNKISKAAIQTDNSLKEVTTDLDKQRMVNKKLCDNVNELQVQRKEIQKEIERVKEENKSLKRMNKEVIEKYKEIENRLKLFMINSVRETEMKNNLVISSDNYDYNYNNNNYKEKQTVPIEELKPAKLILK